MTPTGGVVMSDETQGSPVVNEILERIGEAVGRGANVSAVFGEPVQRDGLTVVPVARARFGFGGGGGSGPEGEGGSGGGGGGGGAVTPIGYIEVRDSGAQFKRITTAADLLALVASASLAALAVKRLLA